MNALTELLLMQPGAFTVTKHDHWVLTGAWPLDTTKRATIMLSTGSEPTWMSLSAPIDMFDPLRLSISVKFAAAGMLVEGEGIRGGYFALCCKHATSREIAEHLVRIVNNAAQFYLPVFVKTYDAVVDLLRATVETMLVDTYEQLVKMEHDNR